MSPNETQQLVASVSHWHHKFEIVPGIITPGSYDPAFLWKMLNATEVSGLRALDLGASDGFFSLQLGRLGANVVAVDYKPKTRTGFSVMERASGLSYRHVHSSIYDLPSVNIGVFDLVLFLGVLYHLPDMMRGLRIVRMLAKSGARVFIETAYDPKLSGSVAAYFRADTWNRDSTNFWKPSRDCVYDMLGDVGLSPIREKSWGERIFFECSATDATNKVDRAYRALS